MKEFPSFLKEGEPVRLIPVLAESNKEQRATSVTLAALTAVDEFGRGLLKMVGALVGKRAHIECYTKIVFQKSGQSEKLRPDGLIIVTSGKKQWSALIESKIGSSELDQSQIENYLDLARENSIDAVITISNQFTLRADHHPVNVNRNKLRLVSLYHWSWSFIVTEALLYAEHRGINDPDQAYILGELIRYFRHESSGVLGFKRMPPSWKQLCDDIQQSVHLSKTYDYVTECVRNWHELTRSMALSLSITLGRSVSVHLSSSHQKNSDKRLDDDIAGLISDKCLSAIFSVPDAASRIDYVADVARRTVTVSMTLQAPSDRSRAKSTVTWIIKQLDNSNDENILIVADWPGRSADSMALLRKLREDPAMLVDGRKGVLPRAFHVRYVVDLGSRFKGTRKFVEEASQVLPDFYENVGQNLKAWIPKPPALTEEKNADGNKSDPKPNASPPRLERKTGRFCLFG